MWRYTIPRGVTTFKKPSGSQAREAVLLEHVRDLLGSKFFANSPKLSRFLEFTVQRTLAGDPDSIKEYTLGVEIYGRHPTYDPRTDAIVRVEARRLRAKLNQYYSADAASCRVRIEYPKGTYVPLFHFTG